MRKPGRPEGSGTPAEFRRELARRIKEARETRTDLDQARMAQELTRRSQRIITADTYRKYEAADAKTPTLMPYDLVLHFCDITQTHPFDFLRPVPLTRAARMAPHSDTAASKRATR